MLGEIGIKKPPLTWYVRWDRHEKPRFTENASPGWYEKSPLT